MNINVRGGGRGKNRPGNQIPPDLANFRTRPHGADGGTEPGISPRQLTHMDQI